MFGGMIMDINVKCVFVFIFFVIFVLSWHCYNYYTIWNPNPIVEKDNWPSRLFYISFIFMKKAGGSGATSFAEIYYSIPSGKCSLYLRKKVGWLMSRIVAALYVEPPCSMARRIRSRSIASLA